MAEGAVEDGHVPCGPPSFRSALEEDHARQDRRVENIPGLLSKPDKFNLNRSAVTYSGMHSTELEQARLIPEPEARFFVRVNIDGTSRDCVGKHESTVHVTGQLMPGNISIWAVEEVHNKDRGIWNRVPPLFG